MNVSESTSLLEAKRYYGMGFCLIPVPVGKKGPAKGFNWKKYQDKRPRSREIERWFTKPNDVAVVLGKVSGGLACRDFDEAEAYHAWAAAYPNLASSLPTSKTPRGFHVYFVTDGNDVDLPTGKNLINFDDGELRLSRCLCKLPPSRHDGGEYRWLIEPFHGIPLVRSVASAGLISTNSKTGFGGARAPANDTYQGRPIHHQKKPLFGVDGELDDGVFDDLLGWTIPSGPGQREDGIWQACRQLKSSAETRSLPFTEILPIVRRWYQLALPNIATKDIVETLAAFGRAWERAWAFGHGETMHDVLERARRAGCPEQIRGEYGNHILGTVVAICRELAIVGGGMFFLDVRTLGRLVWESPNQAAKYLKLLDQLNIIRRVTDPKRGNGREKGQACEYRYLLSLE